MTTKGNLTALLKPEYAEKGYTLSEDEDFVYLDLDNKIVGVFCVQSFHLGKIDTLINSGAS